ncbi:cytoplasmic protein [Bacillus sp. FJAT-27225]|uniref:NIPSNAP family protein n=1 Tax=Bacillus sp. FJAT-27225 TaxID=1743144 RepID=UPI00080C2140|nr:NIPSNAP family protein [Bacillus sp. FJAT-27225]OCA88201.1 cytoplasmic protein [Bacillus sp. FJAT-27225]
MFYRRKSYIVKNDFVDSLNTLFNDYSFLKRLHYGARLTGRWMVPIDAETTEIFSIWEYDNFESFLEIEATIREDEDHLQQVNSWYDAYGGKDYVYKQYIVEVRDEQIRPTFYQYVH